MQRLKTPLTLLTVLTIAALFIANVALAAEVTQVHTSKGHISIDEGKNAGFIMGSQVCFYSFSGEEITCGQVRRTSDNIAMVKVNKRKAKKIKRGMTARLKVSTKHQKDD